MLLATAGECLTLGIAYRQSQSAKPWFRLSAWDYAAQFFWKQWKQSAGLDAMWSEQSV